MKTKFDINNIPTAELVKIGLYENGKLKIDEKNLELLLQGQITGLLPIKNLKVPEGQVQIEARIRLIEKNGVPSFVYYPKYDSIKKDNSLLNEEEKSKLINGELLRKDVALWGKIKNYGEAPYKNIENNTKSFYITIEKENGEEKTIWGKELKEPLEKLLKEKEEGKEKLENIQIKFVEKEKVTVQPRQILEINGEKKAFINSQLLFDFLKKEIKGNDLQQLKINDNKIELNAASVENYDEFLGKYSNVIDTKDVEVEKNIWEVEELKEGQIPEERVLILEFDEETNSFIGIDSADIPELESVNGMKVTPEQAREFKDGKRIVLPDNTELQYSPLRGFKSNRGALIVSVILDGGISFIMFQIIKAILGKIKMKGKEQEKYKEGYANALKDLQKNLKNSLKTDPLNKEIRRYLVKIENELTRLETEPKIKTENKEEIIGFPMKTVEGDLKNKIQESLEKGESLEQYKEVLEQYPDVIDGLELTEQQKAKLAIGELKIDKELSYIIKDGELYRNLEGLTDKVDVTSVAYQEKEAIKQDIPNAEIIENQTLIKKQLKYLQFTDEKLIDEVMAKIEQKKSFTANYSFEIEGKKFSVDLSFKENEGKIEWNRYNIQHEGRNQNFIPKQLWGIDSAVKLITGEMVKASFKDENGEVQNLELKLDFTTKDEEGNYNFKRANTEEKETYSQKM